MLTPTDPPSRNGDERVSLAGGGSDRGRLMVADAIDFGWGGALACRFRNRSLGWGLAVVGGPSKRSNLSRFSKVGGEGTRTASSTKRPGSHCRLPYAPESRSGPAERGQRRLQRRRPAPAEVSPLVQGGGSGCTGTFAVRPSPRGTRQTRWGEAGRMIHGNGTGRSPNRGVGAGPANIRDGRGRKSRERPGKSGSPGRTRHSRDIPGWSGGRPFRATRLPAGRLAPPPAIADGVGGP